MVGGLPASPWRWEMGEEEQGRGYLTPVLSHALFPAQATASGRKLYAALQEYAKRYSWAGMGRVHKGLRDQATLNDRSSIQKPHLFFLPDVPSIPFFPRDAHRHDIEVLEANYPVILAEFQAVYQRGMDPKMGWTGLGPKGQAVFPLYNAGVCVAGNWRSCPCTYRTLLTLRTFIRVQIPPQCELVVGGEPQCWSEGHCLLVDDSFLHTVSHNAFFRGLGVSDGDFLSRVPVPRLRDVKMDWIIGRVECLPAPVRSVAGYGPK
ncbi:aspartate beta-hydroxylase domain-containing protein 2-like [Coregonus clupeaformis]|uniref:aspartate beta-hydroxylase domain-containing protein 2-like n=1 Tax=Coregonus clupeaformis TaxID=59861 RepID=UPI001BE07AA2|nr:aspartate beta-hydroxylase domain-containing protein 2-like [Coregonus clupeaformis]